MHTENLKYRNRSPLTLATLKNKIRMKVMTVPTQSFLSIIIEKNNQITFCDWLMK